MPPTTIPIIMPPTTIPIIMPPTTNPVGTPTPNGEIFESSISDNKQDNQSYCSMEEILNSTCMEGRMNLSDIDDIKNYLKNNIEEEDSFYRKLKTGNVIIQFATMEEQKNVNDNEASSIDLGKDCEAKIRETNNVDPDKELIVYKVDVKTSDLSSTYVQMEVYNPDNMNTPLDLTICENIIINTPVNIGNNLEDIYNSLNDEGYNLFDSEDSFYQDICSTYTSLTGTDMILSDRKKEIYSATSDITMCQTGCSLKSYDSNTKKAKCNCDTSSSSVSLSEIDIDTLFNKNEIKESFYDTLSNSNFRVLKCYKKVFCSKFIKNIGGIFMTIITIAFLFFDIFSYFLHQKTINNFIMTIIKLKEENKIANTENKFQKEKKNNLETSKINTEINTKKKKKGKKKKKKKKKESPEQILFPPKRIKNRINETKKIGVESSNKNLKNENDNIKNKNKRNKKKEINDINISPNVNFTDNYNYINTKEKVNIKSNEELEKPKDNINYENIDITKLNDQEINDLKYEIAHRIDKRTYFQYYLSLLKRKHLILFTFWPTNDYNIYTIKISLFLLSFGLYISINGFFFSDDTMHKLYEDKGKYNIIYRIPQILFSTIISVVINILLKKLSLTEENILSIKHEKDNQKMMEKSKKIHKGLKIKFIIYLVLSILLMLFFWYFISCFCAVYKNTQIVLIKDTLVSYALSMVYPFGLNLLPGIFRIPALKAEKGDQAYKYKIGQMVALI